MDRWTQFEEYLDLERNFHEKGGGDRNFDIWTHDYLQKYLIQLLSF